jgi:hypothetical protein
MEVDDELDHIEFVDLDLGDAHEELRRIAAVMALDADRDRDQPPDGAA